MPSRPWSKARAAAGQGAARGALLVVVRHEANVTAQAWLRGQYGDPYLLPVTLDSAYLTAGHITLMLDQCISRHNVASPGSRYGKGSDPHGGRAGDRQAREEPLMVSFVLMVALITLLGSARDRGSLMVCIGIARVTVRSASRGPGTPRLTAAPAA